GRSTPPGSARGGGPRLPRRSAGHYGRDGDRVMLTSSRITLKHHRLEVGASLIAMLAIGVLARVVTFRLSSLAVNPDCYDRFIVGSADASCEAAFRAFDEVRQAQS